MPPLNVAGIILAAGASSRMGSPKPLLPFRGETFLTRLIRIFRAHCEDVMVVARAEFEVEGARVVVNPDPERGMLSSLQCGLAALAGTADAAMFTPVDYPAIAESTVESIARGWQGEMLRIPRYQGRRGHPVLVARTVIRELLEQPPDAVARDVIHRHLSEIVHVDVDDPAVLNDVDTPADYASLK